MACDDVQTEDSTSPQQLEALAAARDELLRGGPFVRSRRRCDRRVARGEHRRVGHRHHQHQMLPGESKAVRHQFLGSLRVLHVRQDDDHRAAAQSQR